MVLITKEEKEAILAQYPNIHVRRTMQQKGGSKRHRYYMEESSAAMNLLSEIRGSAQERD